MATVDNKITIYVDQRMKNNFMKNVADDLQALATNRLKTTSDEVWIIAIYCHLNLSWVSSIIAVSDPARPDHRQSWKSYFSRFFPVNVDKVALLEYIMNQHGRWHHFFCKSKMTSMFFYMEDDQQIL